MTLEFLQETVTLASMELPEFNTIGFYKGIDVMLKEAPKIRRDASSKSRFLEDDEELVCLCRLAVAILLIIKKDAVLYDVAFDKLLTSKCPAQLVDPTLLQFHITTVYSIFGSNLSIVRNKLCSGGSIRQTISLIRDRVKLEAATASEEKDEDITSHSSVGASSSQSQLDCLSRLESAIDEMFIASAHVETWAAYDQSHEDAGMSIFGELFAQVSAIHNFELYTRLLHV
jgi:hypothetical protein